jgi:hypothetical protein
MNRMGPQAGVSTGVAQAKLELGLGLCRHFEYKSQLAPVPFKAQRLFLVAVIPADCDQICRSLKVVGVMPGWHNGPTSNAALRTEDPGSPESGCFQAQQQPPLANSAKATAKIIPRPSQPSSGLSILLPSAHLLFLCRPDLSLNPPCH